MTLTQQIKQEYYSQATRVRADISYYQGQMSEVKQKAQAEGLTLSQAERLSLDAEILEIGVSICLTILQYCEKEIAQLDSDPTRYDRVNPYLWAQGVAEGQRIAEQWLKGEVTKWEPTTAI